MTEQDWSNIFSDNLISLLNEANMTQQELSKETGLSRATISSYINGRRLPGIKAIINIGYVLDCDLNELIDFGDLIE